MSLVGRQAPTFRTDAVINGGEFAESFSLEQYLGEKFVVLFFYPLDFTFVCPTEILAFQEKLEEFHKRDCEVVGCSVDSKFSHWAWLNTPRDQGGIQGVTYPLVADLDKTIAHNYEVLAGEYDYNSEGELQFLGVPQAYRGLFLIDKQGIVRHQLVNDMPLGRNVEEAIRMVDALRHFEQFGEVCPANWQEGKEAMHDTFEGVSSYIGKTFGS